MPVSRIVAPRGICAESGGSETQHARVCLCLCRCDSDGIHFRHRARFAVVACFRFRSLEGRNAECWKQPAPRKPGEHSACRSSCRFPRFAGRGKPLPAKHRARICHRSRLPNKASCVVHALPRPGWIRPRAHRAVLQTSSGPHRPGTRRRIGLTVEGQEARKKSEAISVVVNTVDLNYFSTMGIPLVEGRDFSENDRDVSTPAAIINDTMAAKYWPNQDPLGKRFQLPQGKSFLQVVGVAKTTNYQTLGEPPQACVYLPLRQNYADSMILYLRSERDPSAVLSSVQEEIHSLDPGLPLEDIRTGTKVIDQALWWSKMGVGLLGVFGFLALGLASVGLYGIMAYSVNQRRREIGVRMALGANQGNVSLLVLRQGMTVVGSGVVAGMVLSLLLGRVLSRFLYGVSGSDPLSLGGASFALLAVAFVACYLPARSASRVDPLVALREA